MSIFFNSIAQVFIILIILNVTLFFFHKKVGNFSQLFAKNNNKPNDKNLIPAIGGIYFFINFFFYNFLIYILDIQFYDALSSKQFLIRTKFIFYFSSILIFLVGFLDDKFNLSYKLKILIFITICYLPFSINDQLIVNYLTFSFYEQILALDGLSLFISIFSIFLLINIFNMFDGVDGQAGIFILIISTYLFVFKNLNILLPLIVTSLFFLYFNLNGKMILGNNGSYFISFILGLIIISHFKLDFDFKVDEIILLVLYPTLDMVRLFTFRICKGKNPFVGDRNHLHHMLYDKFKNLFYVNLNSALQITIPLVINFFYSSYIAFIVSIFCYSFILFLLKKNK